MDLGYRKISLMGKAMNKEVFEGLGKRKIRFLGGFLYLTGAAKAIKRQQLWDLKIRWLHPLGFLVIVIFLLLSPIDAVFSRDSIFDIIKSISKHTIKW